MAVDRHVYFYGKREEWLDLIRLSGGGERSHTLLKSRLSRTSFKFEAGTRTISGTADWRRLCEWYGPEQIAAHEHELTTYALQRLKEIPTMRIFGEAADRGAVISFLVGDIHHFRSRNFTRPLRYCRPYRTSLCPTFDATPWHRGDSAGFVCHVQYEIGN